LRLPEKISARTVLGQVDYVTEMGLSFEVVDPTGELAPGLAEG